MKLSYRWLQELVVLDGIAAAEVAHALTFHTSEIEDTISLGDTIDEVVTARVKSVAPHPDADRLRICQVELADGAVKEVVCGAPNVAADQVICYAPLGITLPGSGEGPIKLKPRKIRGVLSDGMICAEDELGLGDDHDGIVVLPSDTPLGVPVADALGVRDTVLEIDNIAITHRPDLWGHVGFAREVAALTRRDFREPSVPKQSELDAEAKSQDAYPVTVDDGKDCRRYVAIELAGLANGPSPSHLKRRLAVVGVRSIDLLVDLTNYVLLEQGQPVHAFDTRTIEGDAIRVRRAAKGESMVTLDGEKRALTPNDLVIADTKKPIAIAGVMGSEGSGIQADTTSLVLESATFDPTLVRKTAARLGLRTDASSRFEKSLDPEGAMRTALRFVALAKEYCPSAHVTRVITDVYPNPYPSIEIDVPYSLVRRRLGVRVGDSAARRRLKSVGFGVGDAGDSMHIKVPSWRATKDVHIAEDIVEEVGRLGGYDKLEEIAPIAPMVPHHPPPDRRTERLLTPILTLDRGYAETNHYAFYGSDDVKALGIEDSLHVVMTNPRSDQQDRLIQTTAAGLLRSVARNASREREIRIAERARLFAPRAGALPHEVKVLGAVNWRGDAEQDPKGRVFRSLLADLHAVLYRACVGTTSVAEHNGESLVVGLPAYPWLHPGRRAVVRDSAKNVLAIAGEIAPWVMRTYDLPGRAAMFEVDLSAVTQACTAADGEYHALLRYPVVPFDVAVLIPRKTLSSEIADAMRGAVKGNIRDVHVFDVYEGEGVPDGQRSIALRCELFDVNKTLSSKAADALRGKILKALKKRGWTVRGPEA